MLIIFRVEDEKTPIEYIEFIHKKLVSICQESGLQGLKYFGGPEVTCKGCKKRRVLRCVTYGIGTNADVKKVVAHPNCFFCKGKRYDVNKLLQVCSDHVLTAFLDYLILYSTRCQLKFLTKTSPHPSLLSLVGYI